MFDDLCLIAAGLIFLGGAIAVGFLAEPDDSGRTWPLMPSGPKPAPVDDWELALLADRIHAEGHDGPGAAFTEVPRDMLGALVAELIDRRAADPHAR